MKSIQLKPQKRDAFEVFGMKDLVSPVEGDEKKSLVKEDEMEPLSLQVSL
jgi:hypothetical protein